MSDLVEQLKKLSNEEKNKILEIFDPTIQAVINQKIEDKKIEDKVQEIGENYKKEHLLDIHSLQNNRYLIQASVRSRDHIIDLLKKAAGMVLGTALFVISLLFILLWVRSSPAEQKLTSKTETKASVIIANDTTKNEVTTISDNHESGSPPPPPPAISGSDILYTIEWVAIAAFAVLVIIGSIAAFVIYKVQRFTNDHLYPSKEVINSLIKAEIINAVDSKAISEGEKIEYEKYKKSLQC